MEKGHSTVFRANFLLLRTLPTRVFPGTTTECSHSKIQTLSDIKNVYFIVVRWTCWMQENLYAILKGRVVWSCRWRKLDGKDGLRRGEKRRIERKRELKIIRDFISYWVLRMREAKNTRKRPTAKGYFRVMQTSSVIMSGVPTHLNLIEELYGIQLQTTEAKYGRDERFHNMETLQRGIRRNY